MTKTKLHITAIIALLSLIVTSCGLPGGGNKKEITPTNIYGKWQEGTNFERYYADSIEYVLQNDSTIKVVGTTWDEADDMTEQDALPFNWTLNDNNLLQTHINFNGTVTPKTYTVTELTANVFVYHDDHGVEHSFTKVKEPIIEQEEQ